MKQAWTHPLLYIIVAVLAVGASLAFIATGWRQGDAVEGSGLGDYLSGVAAFGIGIASTVLFFGALVIQAAELRNQRYELRLQRSELHAARVVAAEQAAALKAQEKELQDQNRLAREQLIAAIDQRDTETLIAIAGGIKANSEFIPYRAAASIICRAAETRPLQALQLIDVFAAVSRFYDGYRAEIFRKAMDSALRQCANSGSLHLARPELNGACWRDFVPAMLRQYPGTHWALAVQPAPESKDGVCPQPACAASASAASEGIEVAVPE